MEQFVLDVGSMPPETVEALGAAFLDRGAILGGSAQADLAEFVRCVYVMEYTQRIRAMATRLLGGELVDPLGSRDTTAAADDDHDDDHDGDADTMRAVLSEYQEAVVRGTSVDPTTTELVRLRCARTHRCTICSTLRLADARREGVDDDLTSQIDFYERSNLPEAVKAALRITDACIIRPDLLTDAVVDQACELYSEEQVAELLLDVSKWSTQKINVSLGTDGLGDLEVNEDGVAFFGFDERG
ncbi:MAG: carboxymuconolactone decarboxylase family protein, partial [Ilumatobacteraceae bacterium]